MLTDPTPAAHLFIVAAPWWRNPVVAGPGLLLILGIIFQSARVVRGKQRLEAANQVLERLRGQAQGMQSSEDIGPVVEAVHRELTGLGLPVFSSGMGIYPSGIPEFGMES